VRGCTAFDPFLNEKNNIDTRWEKPSMRKSHIFNGSNYRENFFLYKGVLRASMRGCVEFAPFWMKNNNTGTPM
jgi:hypothetical protein